MQQILKDPILEREEDAWAVVRQALSDYREDPSDKNAEAVHEAWLEVRRLNRLARWRAQKAFRPRHT